MSLSGSTGSTVSIREQQQRVSLSLQLPAWRVVARALVAGVRLLGLALVVDDGQVLAAHLLGLLVDGELLRELGFAFLCRDSA